MNTTACSFGRGRTTASYPEQVFPSLCTGNVWFSLSCKQHAISTTVWRWRFSRCWCSNHQTGCKGVIGNNYINLLDVDVTPTITAGVSGTFGVLLTLTGVAVGQKLLVLVLQHKLVLLVSLELPFT